MSYLHAKILLRMNLQLLISNVVNFIQIYTEKKFAFDITVFNFYFSKKCLICHKKALQFLTLLLLLFIYLIFNTKYAYFYFF